MAGGYVAGKVTLPDLREFVELPLLPGLHGTYSEQHVPLVFLGSGVEEGSTVGKMVSVVDIVPTILDLNGWDADDLPGMEGESLYHLLKK